METEKWPKAADSPLIIKNGRFFQIKVKITYLKKKYFVFT